MQAFLMQQSGDLLVAEMRQKSFTSARCMHWQFAADRCRHAHQLRTLYLIDNHRLKIAEVQHRQIDRFTRVFHQRT